MWFIGKSFTQFGFDIISSRSGMAHSCTLLPCALSNVFGMNILIISPIRVIRRTDSLTRGNEQADLLILKFSIILSQNAVTGRCEELQGLAEKRKRKRAVCEVPQPLLRCIWLDSQTLEQHTGQYGASQRLLTGVASLFFQTPPHE